MKQRKDTERIKLITLHALCVCVDLYFSTLFVRNSFYLLSSNER